MCAPQTKLAVASDRYAGTPDGQPKSRWCRHVAAARAFLESDAVAGEPVCALGEVQIMLTKYAAVRNKMHEPCKQDMHVYAYFSCEHARDSLAA